MDSGNPCRGKHCNLEGERLTATVESLATNLAIILTAVNLMLFVGGFVQANDVPTISRILTGVNLSEPNSSEFQQSLFVKDSDGKNLGDTTGDSFAVTVLDFLETVPILGPLITLVRIVYELLFMLAFTFVNVLFKMGVPFSVIVVIGGTNFVIYVIAITNLLLRVIASRGGSK